jgi:hypothetical protein
MRATIHFGDGSEKNFEHVAGHAITPEGFLVVFNKSKEPIVLAPAGMVGLVYPDNDSPLVKATGLVSGDGKPISLT